MNGTILPTARSGTRWYAAAVQPHSDALARDQLARQGFVVFAPTFTRTVRHARQFRTKLIPLFPGYLFVRMDLEEERWRAINGTRGVRGLVTAGERPVPVPESVIAAIMAETTQGLAAELLPGRLLDVIAGPFAGLVGRLERFEGAARVAVLMEVIGSGPVTVSLPRSAVRTA